MQLEVGMDRRKFGADMARVLMGGAALVISGCGSDSISSPSAPTLAPATDALGTVSSNHNHVAVISAAQLNASGGLDLDIKGTSGHGHMISLTALEVNSIRRGNRLEKMSTGTGHTHLVTFNAQV
jgi:hypothetical protein